MKIGPQAAWGVREYVPGPSAPWDIATEMEGEKSGHELWRRYVPRSSTPWDIAAKIEGEN